MLELAEELRGGVPLLGRDVAVVDEDLVDERGEEPERGAGRGLERGRARARGRPRPRGRCVVRGERCGGLPNGPAIAVHCV